MIEINLVPDVKQELIKAKRVRTLVISGTVIVGIAAVAIVVLLAVWRFGVQSARTLWVEDDIKKNLATLKDTPDLANMLTIQNQLTQVTKQHDEKGITSRVFELLTAINPPAPNQVTFSSFKFDAENTIIHIDAQAVGGFVAADVFKKTIQAVTFTYQPNSESNNETKPLVSDAVLSNLSYGEDASGAKVLRFSADLTYSPELFAATSKNVRIIRPGEKNATDSYKYLPESLFSSRAKDIGGAQ